MKFSITDLKAILFVSNNKKWKAKELLTYPKEYLLLYISDYMSRYLFTYEKEIGLLYRKLKASN